MHFYICWCNHSTVQLCKLILLTTGNTRYKINQVEATFQLANILHYKTLIHTSLQLTRETKTMPKYVKIWNDHYRLFDYLPNSPHCSVHQREITFNYPVTSMNALWRKATFDVLAVVTIFWDAARYDSTDVSGNVLPPSSRLKNRHRKKHTNTTLYTVCFLLSLLYYPEDGGSTFLRNVD
jgi:hypothetical protein